VPQAVPHVSGAIARVWAAFPSCDANIVRTAFQESALDLGPKGQDVQFGYGLVQAEAAYDYLARQPCAKGWALASLAQQAAAADAADKQSQMQNTSTASSGGASMPVSSSTGLAEATGSTAGNTSSSSSSGGGSNAGVTGQEGIPISDLGQPTDAAASAAAPTPAVAPSAPAAAAAPAPPAASTAAPAAAAVPIEARAPVPDEAPRPVLTPVLTAPAAAGTQAVLSDWMPRVIRQPSIGR
jgi:hypothetical protein